MVGPEHHLGPELTWRVGSEELSQLAREVEALARQHRAKVAAIGVRGPVGSGEPGLRAQLAAALGARGLGGVRITVTPANGPLRLDVIEFAP